METLDGYEDFFKEYTQYIKNYKNEDSSKLQEYAKKSEDIIELLEKYDTSGFNKKEEIYLADVKYRIDKMLASIKNRLPEWNDESGRDEHLVYLEETCGDISVFLVIQTVPVKFFSRAKLAHSVKRI